MRILDATPPQDELGQLPDCLNDDAATKTIEPSRAGAWGTISSGGSKLCDKSARRFPTDGRSMHSSQSHPNVTPTLLRSSGRSLVMISHAMCLLVLVSMVLQPAAAVLLANWQNCLDDGIKYSDPKELQWTPLYVGAQFEKGDVARTLRVTAWGNVSGSYGGVSLPAWNSAEWDDTNFTDGKIVQNPFPTTAARLTTLHDKVEVLTYEPYAADFDFCEDALTNKSCPLGPVFNTTAVYVYIGTTACFQKHPATLSNEAHAHCANIGDQCAARSTFMPTFKRQNSHFSSLLFQPAKNLGLRLTIRYIVRGRIFRQYPCPRISTRVMPSRHSRQLCESFK